MKISICQLPDNLTTQDSAWRDFQAWLGRERPDLAILNEMPFGAWLARALPVAPGAAQQSVLVHDGAMPSLEAMPCAVLASRPRAGAQKLSNEAFLIADGLYTPIHHKHYFPEEPGFFEDSLFSPEMQGFDVATFKGLRIGVLLCTELMFTEWARHYRRLGAHVIAVPRASGSAMRTWHAAAAMAAIVSGCYVCSSNRVSPHRPGASEFGGRGFVYSPTGELLVETSSGAPFASIEIDMAKVAAAQRDYPCYVRELAP